MAYSEEPTVVEFTCPSGLVLSGPDTATCMNGSLWEPDPMDVKCLEGNQFT